jgi:hypothetical protein
VHMASVYEMEQRMWLVYTRWNSLCGRYMPGETVKGAGVYKPEQWMWLCIRDGTVCLSSVYEREQYILPVYVR